MIHVGGEAAHLCSNQFSYKINGMADRIHPEQIAGNFLWAISSRIASYKVELPVVLSVQDE